MHPPGVLTSHIFGSIARMFRLNSDENNTVSDVVCFYHNFTKRGHKEDILTPLFLKAVANARRFMMKSGLQRKLDKEKKVEATRRRLYFHLGKRFKTLLQGWSSTLVGRNHSMK